MLAKKELEAMIASLRWNCTLFDNDGETTDFPGIVAQWGRTGWRSYEQYEAPMGVNKYVILATTDAPIAEIGCRIVAVRGGVTKKLQVMQCHVMDFKIEIMCEELI